MRLTSNTKTSLRRSKRLHRNGRLHKLILWQGISGAVVEDDFYNKLEKLNVQARKKKQDSHDDSVGACATHMRSA